MAVIWCFLALLCFASCVAENTEREWSFNELQLQQDSFPWLGKLPDKESTEKHRFIELLHNLLKFENGHIIKGPTDTEKQEKKRRGLVATTRGPGCRVFYWKSRTAC